MRPRTIAVVSLTTAVTVAALMSPAAPTQLKAGGKVKVRIVGVNNGKEVTNGGVAGRGHFTATGAITEAGTVVGYRTVKGSLLTRKALITVRFVTVGKKGTITFVVKADVKPTGTTSRWTIASGTKTYKGLHGSGAERENDDHTLAILTGTVSR